MQYEIKALAGNGLGGNGPPGSARLVRLMLDAGDSLDAIRQAQTQGLTVIGVKPKASWQVWRRFMRHQFPVVLFSQELLSLLEAGLPLVQALETLAEKELRPEVKQTLRQVSLSLHEGHTLSHALQHSGAGFPALYVETIRASEKTGALGEALARYISYQTRMDMVRNQLVSAAIYPALVMTVGGLVMLFLMLYVVPRFSSIYAGIHADLPLVSRMLMQWGLFLEKYGAQVLAATVILAGGVVYALLRPASRQWIKQRLWRTPAIGARMRIYQLARFYRSLGMLLRGGMPVVPALQMVSGLLEESLRERLQQATALVRKGRSLSQSMEECGLTTAVALNMIRVGERTGQMGDMMERIASFHEEETARWVERFIRVFEPLLMACVGVAVGAIVVMMYFPIFELAGSIK
jgi:general secretion pathway protein F